MLSLYDEVKAKLRRFIFFAASLICTYIYQHCLAVSFRCVGEDFEIFTAMKTLDVEYVAMLLSH